MVNYLVQIINDNASRFGDDEAFRYQQTEKGKWLSLSWIGFRKQVVDISYALAMLGVGELERVGIFSQNRKDLFVTDFACYRDRIAPVPIYATSSLEQVEYIAKDAELRIIFAGDQSQYHIARRVQAVCDNVKHIVVYDDSVILDSNDNDTKTFAQLLDMGANASEEIKKLVAARVEAGQPDDIACLMYTSGTTGTPKGVVLDHENFAGQLALHQAYYKGLRHGDLSMNFLPVSHIFERGYCYWCISVGVAIAINTNPKEILPAIREVNPNLMCSVPRFWEKVYTTIQNYIARMPFLKRAFVRYALSVGKKRNMEYVRFAKKVPYWLERQWRFVDRLVFSRVREVIGIHNGKFLPTAGAPIAPAIVEFLQSIGLNIVVGYGLTESLATVCLSPIDGIRLGALGKPLPGVDVKIGDNNEIVIKGPGILRKYYNKPKETAEAFTADGYFRTGDAGYIDADGYVFLTERIKDLFKTSNGKYIAPQALESRLGTANTIEQVSVIGDQRKFVTALIVPNLEAIKTFAKENNIKYNSIEELIANEQVHAFVEAEINSLQQDFAHFEQIKRFTLLPKPFTMESGELTNTLKIKRNVVAKHYADVIDEMYK